MKETRVARIKRLQETRAGLKKVEQQLKKDKPRNWEHKVVMVRQQIKAINERLAKLIV